MDLAELKTEQRNPNSIHIDTVTTEQLVQIINEEDQKVAPAIAEHIQAIADALNAASERYNRGGRLIYIGAGTSGRLGVLDAAELVPTYSVSADRAFGLIAGGNGAMFRAVEGAEDDLKLAEKDLTQVKLDADDIVVGIAASGRTPYVIGGLQYSQKVGALTIAVSCNEHSQIGEVAEYAIDVPVGPEVITGSTRMKAGTAQKMILNILSTGIMIKNGKVYQNLMINVQATNAKLKARGLQIISDATGCNLSQAQAVLDAAGGQVNVAILMQLSGVDAETAKTQIIANGGLLANSITE